MKTRRSVLSPGLLVPLGLVLLALCYFGYQWYADGQRVVDERRKLLDHIAIELDKEVPDASELSRLTARIQKLSDHDSAPDLMAAVARIELARGRPERAYAQFVPVASRPGALPVHKSLAAEILLRHHQAGVASRGDALLMLEQALLFGDQAHDASDEVADLMRAWLAAMRMSDKERVDVFASRIEAEHPESAAHRLVGLCRHFSLQTDRNDVELVRAEFDQSVAEIEAMLAMLILSGGDVPAAVTHTEGMLSKSPGIVEVRWAAAVVFHACVAGSVADSGDRAQWSIRRNAQLDWLIDHGAPDDARRPKWAAMRDSQ